jgi:putative tryptophan/tyrosine transport system substrate-binding protein
VGLLVAAGEPARPLPLVERLQELGYVAGRDLAVEFRSADGHVDRLPALAEDLVRLPVDVIVTGGEQAALAARDATATIPIVIQYVSDPVKDGLVASLARPGGNVTGVTGFAPQLSGKRLELMRETIPGLARVAALDNKERPTDVTELEDAARALGLEVRFGFLDVNAMEPSVDAVLAGGAQAVLVRGAAATVPPLARRLAEILARRRVPALYADHAAVSAGGLMSYGPNIDDLYRRAGDYVDRILKGAKPGDLPVEQPTVLNLAINRATARALGLDVPQSVLRQATEIIE